MKAAPKACSNEKVVGQRMFGSDPIQLSRNVAQLVTSVSRHNVLQILSGPEVAPDRIHTLG